MLDAIDEENENLILHIREPFHGALLKIKHAGTLPHDQAIDRYNDSHYKLDINLRWHEHVIFIRRRLHH